jgi:hypothetical protein
MTEPLDRLWTAARAHARVPDEFAVQLITFHGEPDGEAPWGCWFEPGSDAFKDGRHLFRFSEAERRQAEQGRAGHQVLVYTGAPDQVLIALMRHELEHVRQFAQGIYVSRAAGILARTFQLLVEPDLPGAFRGLYPYLPTEQDACARGTALARDSFGPPPLAMLASPHATLLTTASMSGDLASLPARLTGMLAIVPDLAGKAIAERYPTYAAEPMTGLAEVAQGLVPCCGGELLAACMMDPETSRVRDRLPEVIAAAWTASLLGQSKDFAPVGGAFTIVQRRATALAADPIARHALLESVQGAC